MCVCVHVCVWVGLTDVLSASIIQKVSATTPLDAGGKGRQREKKSR